MTNEDSQVYNGYAHQEIEEKYQKDWEEMGLYKTPSGVNKDNKYYILPQLPYPSGSGLHIGHSEVYISCDIYARFQRMQGKKVLQVMGWDSFGLPAENFAIKTNIHPRINTDKAIDNFREQIKKMGVSVDWDREVGSHNADYYKWTQWFFQLMYNQGLAYRKKQAVNWCESCKTVLANEQVEDGACERCDTEVVQKDLEQWFLKITDYADILQKDLDKVDWPQESVKRQRDWIGKSIGALIDFELNSEAENLKLSVYTTAHDTIFGATFMVVAPEHKILEQIKTNISNWKEVSAYIDSAKHKTELDRQIQKEKTGVRLEGVEAINPINGNKIPVFVADYVLVTYGTGAIMGVPGHDERDFEFAKKYDLEVIELAKDHKERKRESKIISYADEIKNDLGGYEVINSGEFDGMTFEEARPKILARLEDLGVGEAKTEYKLRDWLVSRQRFWGAPIPMLYRLMDDNKKKLNDSYQGLPECVINMHAWGSSSKKHYHDWIQSQLEKKGIKSVTPDLVNTDHPKLDEWLAQVDLLLDGTSNNCVLTGRSLGSWTALKLAEKRKFRKLLLVASPLPIKQWDQTIEKLDLTDKENECLKNFVLDDIDHQAINENVGELVFVLSRNDPYISFEESIRYINMHFPFARIMRFRDAGHFDSEHGYSKFEELLEEIIRPVRTDIVMVPQKDLPVILPDDVDFKPTGQSPLTYSPSFEEGVEDKYGKGWKREMDTLDTFMCSSWYYYRYLDPKNNNAFASKDNLDAWMPVDFYIGGPEHVNGHLLYSRFFTKVLYDAGYIDFDEPFAYHRHQGLILAEDGRKMSKRWGNVINPTDVINQYGADTLRVYEMFMGPLDQAKAWSDKSVRGVRRFLQRVYDYSRKYQNNQATDTNEDLKIHINSLILKVTDDTRALKLNTAVSEFMKFLNYVESLDFVVSQQEWEKFVILLSVYAPFITENIWKEILGRSDSIHQQSWPNFDAKLLAIQDITIAVQINGKTRGEIIIGPDEDEEGVTNIAKDDKKISKYLQNGYKKVIYVKGKIVNYIV